MSPCFKTAYQVRSWPPQAASWFGTRVSVGRTNYLLKTLQFKRICPTQACTPNRGGRGRGVGGVRAANVIDVIHIWLEITDTVVLKAKSHITRACTCTWHAHVHATSVQTRKNRATHFYSTPRCPELERKAVNLDDRPSAGGGAAHQKRPTSGTSGRAFVSYSSCTAVAQEIPPTMRAARPTARNSRPRRSGRSRRHSLPVP